jgi:hypothetical protein
MAKPEFLAERPLGRRSPTRLHKPSMKTRDFFLGTTWMEYGFNDQSFTQEAKSGFFLREEKTLLRLTLRSRMVLPPDPITIFDPLYIAMKRRF